LLSTFIVFSILILFSAFAQVPDYYNPYAKISTDKEKYTWTDKVKIRIIAPSWNSNKYLIDEIGAYEGTQIKISTQTNSLKPYRLTETEPSSGIFTGEVTLTGFLHDANGDGNPDTTPITSGLGPTDGFLESKNDDAITITWTFAKDVVLTYSVPISWNMGQIHFEEKEILLDSMAKIIVQDPDVNLDPEVIDQIPVTISSDSDAAGIIVTATETTKDSGLFEGSFSFTTSKPSSGHRLFVVPGNTLYAKYDDFTLPKPYNTSDHLEIKTTAKVISDVPPLDRIETGNTFLADNSGNLVYDPTIHEQLQIVTKVQNKQNFGQPFIYIIQIKDSTGTVVHMSWILGELFPLQQLELSQSWVPNMGGTFIIETFVWDSLTNSIPLAPKISKSYFVQE
jgi:hypothetical protein